MCNTIYDVMWMHYAVIGTDLAIHEGLGNKNGMVYALKFAFDVHDTVASSLEYK